MTHGWLKNSNRINRVNRFNRNNQCDAWFVLPFATLWNDTSILRRLPLRMDLQLQLALKLYAFARQCALLNDYATFLTTVHVIFLNVVLQGCKIYCKHIVYVWFFLLIFRSTACRLNVSFNEFPNARFVDFVVEPLCAYRKSKSHWNICRVMCKRPFYSCLTVSWVQWPGLCFDRDLTAFVV